MSLLVLYESLLSSPNAGLSLNSLFFSIDGFHTQIACCFVLSVHIVASNLANIRIYYFIRTHLRGADARCVGWRVYSDICNQHFDYTR